MRRLSAQNATLTLLLLAIPLGQAGGCATRVSSALLLTAAALALFDYGRRGGQEAALSRSTQLAAAGAVTFGGAAIVGLAAVVRATSPIADGWLSALGILLALVSAGIRRGIADQARAAAGSGPPSDLHTETRLVTLAAAALIARSLLPDASTTAAAANIGAAGLVVLGYVRRPSRPDVV